MVSVCRCRCRRAVVNGSLDLAARAIAQHAFLFHLAIQGAAQKLALQRQMNRARGGSVVRRSKGTEQCDYVVTRVRIYRVDQNLGGYLKPKKCQTSPPQNCVPFAAPESRKRLQTSRTLPPVKWRRRSAGRPTRSLSGSLMTKPSTSASLLAAGLGATACCPGSKPEATPRKCTHRPRSGPRMQPERRGRGDAPILAHLSYFRVLTPQMGTWPSGLFFKFSSSKGPLKSAGTCRLETKHNMDPLDQEPKSPGDFVRISSSNDGRRWYPRKFRSMRFNNRENTRRKRTTKIKCAPFENFRERYLHVML
jgi:hypothetical protein